MTNFQHTFYHYYHFGSLGTTLEGMYQAVRCGRLKKYEAVRILKYGLGKDFYYCYNPNRIIEIVSNFKEELANG